MKDSWRPATLTYAMSLRLTVSSGRYSGVWVHTLETPISNRTFLWAARHASPAIPDLIPEIDTQHVCSASEKPCWLYGAQVKASFLAFYWKLFNGLPKYKKWWMIVSVFVFASYIGCWISSALTCHPASVYFKFGTQPFWRRLRRLLMS